MSIGARKFFKQNKTVQYRDVCIRNCTSNKVTSNELTSSLLTDNRSKINSPRIKYPYWNNTEEEQSINSKSQNIQLSVFDNEIVNNFEWNSQSSNLEHRLSSEMNRDGVPIQSKSKVGKLKKKKAKQQQQIETVTAVAPTVPSFSLQHSVDEFPLLSTSKDNRKKLIVSQNVSTNETENSTDQNCTRHKSSEKSWKPKVKDPILFDIGRALKVKPEKCKAIVKKVDPNAQRSVIVGNILDSDSPQLRKGKVRPDKQKKPTRLKKQILIERKEKQSKILNEKEHDCQSSGATQVILEDELSPNTSHHFGVEEPFELKNQSSNSNLIEEISLSFSNCNFFDTDRKLMQNNDKYGILENVQDVKFKATKSLHSSSFREYCTNCLTEEIVKSVCALLEKLAFFQDRTFDRDPIRAQAKRRYVAGISQTNKYLLVKKVKLLVIAPDVEKNSVEGGLDDIIRNFKNIADKQDVPYVFGPKRRRLGKSVFKKALVSCVAVLSYEGAEEQFSRVLEALNDAKMKYQALVKQEPFNYGLLKKDSNTSVGKDYVSADEVTSSLLAVLRGTQSPADKLLNAIHKAEWPRFDAQRDLWH